MDKKTLIIIVLVLIATVGGYFGLKSYASKKLQENESTPRTTPNPTPTPTPAATPKPTEIINQKNNSMHLIKIETNVGEIQFQTYDADAPKTVENFISLADKGFYDGLIFHRVVKNFVIQGGDPNGTGTGGPGYKFEDELNPNTESYKEGYKKGVVAMANSGLNTNGSQFFIMLQDYPLPHSYTIFGKVAVGQDVVDYIGKLETDSNDKPLQTVIMRKVSVEEISN